MPTIDTKQDHVLRTTYLKFIKAETFPEILSAFKLYKEIIVVKETLTPKSIFTQLRDATPPAVHASRALFKFLDHRAFSKEYEQDCSEMSVLIVGGGPAGLRSAIECALLGCKRVCVLEKRTTISRNNVLHLWPFVITDLKQLGGKEIYRKLGVGDFDHISIWRLQTIYLKLALLLGVEFHLGTEFIAAKPPVDDSAAYWAVTEPALLTPMQLNVLISAEGEKSQIRSTYEFKTKTLNSGLSLGITANFMIGGNNNERNLREGGFISYANPTFFNGLKKGHEIVLENIVYYKAEKTHYFVMTAKLNSLFKKQVIKQIQGVERLLQPGNVDGEKLKEFVREVVQAYGLPAETEYIIDAKGKEDCTIFDFSNKRVSKKASKVIYNKECESLASPVLDIPDTPPVGRLNRKPSMFSMGEDEEDEVMPPSGALLSPISAEFRGRRRSDSSPHKPVTPVRRHTVPYVSAVESSDEEGERGLLVCLVGDSLLEPFWPLGTGAANAALSAMDAAWAIRKYAAGETKPALKAHSAAFHLLQISSAESLVKSGNYTINPATRYRNYKE